MLTEHLVRTVFVDTAFGSLYLSVLTKVPPLAGMRGTERSMHRFSKDFFVEHDAMQEKKKHIFDVAMLEQQQAAASLQPAEREVPVLEEELSPTETASGEPLPTEEAQPSRAAAAEAP